MRILSSTLPFHSESVVSLLSSRVVENREQLTDSIVTLVSLVNPTGVHFTARVNSWLK